MERPDFVKEVYDPVEASIRIARYMNARPYVKGKHVLDVACGEGYGSALLKHWGAKSVVGVDCSREAVSIAGNLFQERDLKFIEHDVEHLPFEDVAFDMVVSLETVEHLENPEAFLLELRRVVKAGGTIIISCPNDRYYAENIPGFDNPFHKHQYSFIEFRSLAERILGDTEKWFLGNALAGFCNVPMKDIDVKYKNAEASKNMMGMMTASEVPEALLAVPIHTLNSKSSLYYVGIWGSERALETACVYPFPHFSLNRSIVPESTEMIKEWQDAYRLLEKNCEEENQIIISNKEEAEKEIAWLKEENGRLIKENHTLTDVQDDMKQKLEKINDDYRVLKNERDRLYLLNDMEKKEETLLWNQVHQVRDELYRLKESYDRLELNYAAVEAEKNRSEALIREMENTRGWKILTIIRKVLLALGWRRRKNASG